MAILVTSFIIILLATIVVYTVIGIVYSSSNTYTDLLPSLTSLSAETQIVDSGTVKTSLLSQGGSTVAGFFNVQFGDRTIRMKGPLITPEPSNQHPALTYTTLLGVKGSFEFQIAPSRLFFDVSGGSNVQIPQSTAQLIVYTTHREFITIPLPPLTQQKWIFISILRDGRRFDVMYDDKIVASHRIDVYPLSIANPLVIGDKALLGQAIHMFTQSSRATPNQISALRASYSDMTGQPPVKFPLPFLPIPFGNVQSSCVPGMPCNPVSAPPNNALKAWSSRYA
jgi:hypothetical protein